jgi:hypothetical protein
MDGARGRTGGGNGIVLVVGALPPGRGRTAEPASPIAPTPIPATAPAAATGAARDCGGEDIEADDEGVPDTTPTGLGDAFNIVIAP